MRSRGVQWIASSFDSILGRLCIYAFQRFRLALPLFGGHAKRPFFRAFSCSTQGFLPRGASVLTWTHYCTIWIPETILCFRKSAPLAFSVWLDHCYTVQDFCQTAHVQDVSDITRPDGLQTCTHDWLKSNAVNAVAVRDLRRSWERDHISAASNGEFVDAVICVFHSCSL